MHIKMYIIYIILWPLFLFNNTAFLCLKYVIGTYFFNILKSLMISCKL